jgi:hypothetical protein
MWTLDLSKQFPSIRRFGPASTALRALALAAGASLLVASQPANAAADYLEDGLRLWVTQNIHFEKDKDSRPVLFIRKIDVRAHVGTDDPELLSDATIAITNLANAFGLRSDFTMDAVNLIVSPAGGVAAGRPTRQVLQSIGLDEAAAAVIAATNPDWSGGCGQYAARTEAGRISFGLSIADRTMATRSISACLVTGIVYAFGMRTKGMTALAAPNDYVQYLLLGRALSACDREISAAPPLPAAKVEETYIACTVGKMKAKLSN